MSMKLLARLSEQRGSFIETSYLRNNDLMVLENVPAEMVFEASQGFMEHESQKHDYLPYFHLIGKIKEIHGSFPFNVTSLYFSAKDESFLIKDLFYYPSPEELGHIIGTGRFYSRHFQIPTILSANTYTLPCRVNLSIIPPANQAQYEANQYTHFMDLDDEDKTNLPVFYVGVTGSGVTRRNDRLLDYYGIDIPEMDEQFVFTAESSGYTDPPLMKYMEAPMVSQEAQREDQQYMEDTKEGLLQTEAERRREELEQVAEKQEQMEFRAATPEDALIAQTDREIERRMAERFDGQRMSLAAAREHDKRVRMDEEQARPMQETVQPGRYDGPKEAAGFRQAEPARNAPARPAAQPGQRLDDYVSGASMPVASGSGMRQPSAQAPAASPAQDRSSAQPKPEDAPRGRQQEAAEPMDGASRSKQEEREKLRARVEQLRGRSRLTPQPAQQPKDKAVAQNQQMKEINMDFDPEHNAHIEAGRAEGEGELAGADKSKLKSMQGGDVADVRDQVKVDEAHAADLARATAQRIAAARAGGQDGGQDGHEVGREVTEPLEKVAKADAEAKARKEQGIPDEPENEDEYL